MAPVNWKYPLVAGIVTAVIEALLQIIAVVFWENPEWFALEIVLVLPALYLLMGTTAFLLSAAYILRTGERKVLGIKLLAVGVVSLALTICLGAFIADFFSTMVAVLSQIDSMGIALAGCSLITYAPREKRRQQEIWNDAQSS